MLWLVGWLAPMLGRIAAGPVLDIIDKLVPDADLKRRLKTEIRGKLVDRDMALIAARRSVVLGEIASESWLTRSWRPLLMFLLMAFLSFFGLVLPIAELALGRSLPLEPRLDRIPEPLWNLLGLGLGGYVGGRTIEKIAANWLSRPPVVPKRPAESRTKALRTRRR
jgi:Holin of 3TMs, for gene-transfer release